MFHRPPHPTHNPSPHSPPNPNSSTAFHPTAVANNSPSSPPQSPPSPPSPSTNNKLLALPPPPTRTPVFPSREDYWTEEATHTLIKAWGSHYLNLNRGNLRQLQWQQVADAVNELHGHTKKLYRTDIQCRHRIDTLKKKYKAEKATVSESNGRYVSTWPFYRSLDALIVSPENFTLSPLIGDLRSKRPTASMAYTVSRRNFAAMAAAVEASGSEEEVSEEDSDTSSLPALAAGRSSSRSEGMVGGYKSLAEAIGRFSETYERVERDKQRQMVELEKQRMQFAKDLEIQRMKLMMESQIYIQKLKRYKRG